MTETAIIRVTFPNNFGKVNKVLREIVKKVDRSQYFQKL
ncbi:hypothetical protein FHS45_003805 [Thalassobacillus devorans]|nr:hypothetical protein [Thalassobacillus devorans]